MDTRQPPEPRGHGRPSASSIYVSFAGPGGHRANNNINGPGLADVLPTWWDEERIATTLTPAFIRASVRPELRARLDNRVGFAGEGGDGDDDGSRGLTDETYLEWIEGRARRLFLLLVELGAADQIFAVLDGSWDDSDLPVPRAHIRRLGLTSETLARVEKRFYQRQFAYLLRHLYSGGHIAYEDAEIVPLDVREAQSALVLANPATAVLDQVHLPGKPDAVMVRQRVALGDDDEDRFAHEEFLHTCDVVRAAQHQHTLSIWATYTHLGHGLILTTPVDAYNLKTLLNAAPQSFKILTKHERRCLLLNWLHCLVTALSHVHGNGCSQGNLTPTNVLFDIDNGIYLGPFDAAMMLFSFHVDRGLRSEEMYVYAAPETIQASDGIGNALADISSSNDQTQSSATRRSGHHLGKQPDSVSIKSSSTSSRKHSLVSRPPQATHDPQPSDIFSLGTIFLEILSLLLKRTTRAFAAHRAQTSRPVKDNSFHANLTQVLTWMDGLAKDAAKKEDRIFRAIKPILGLIRKMLDVDPEVRPSAREVRDSLYNVLSNTMRPSTAASGSDSVLHCTPQRRDSMLSMKGSMGDFAALRLASQRAAAEACRTVAGPLGGPLERVDVALGNGGVIRGVESRTVVIRGMSDGDGMQPSVLSSSSRNVMMGASITRQDKARSQGKENIRDVRSHRSSTASSSKKGKSTILTKNDDGDGDEDEDDEPPPSVASLTHLLKGKKKQAAKAWQAPVYAGESGPEESERLAAACSVDADVASIVEMSFA